MEEKRVDERTEKSIPIMYSFKSDESKRVDDGEVTLNISKGGMYFNTDHEIPVDSKITLKLYIVEKTVICQGEVAWTRKEDNDDTWHIGLKFIGLDEKTKKEIHDFSGIDPE